jgi:hypothetical protein
VWDRGYYSTQFWEPGEYVVDQRTLKLPADLPPGDNYRIVIGFYSVQDGQRATFTQAAEPLGDGFTLVERFSVE